nr:hypothetical protein [candidate division Zixibacteria bacterium]
MSTRFFDQTAISRLIKYDWPGNVRELKNRVKELIINSDSELIIGSDVEKILANKANLETDNKKLAVRMKRYEKTCIIEALHEANYNIARAADILSIERSNLHKKIKYHDIEISLLKNSDTN